MIKGIHHIGVTVSNLDEAVAFYQEAVDLQRIHVDAAHSPEVGGTYMPTALLAGRTAYLEVNQVAAPPAKTEPPMPVFGPGITHICLQSPASDPAFDKFRRAGATMHSRGDTPVKLARRDITYVYLRDAAGNMFEIEQWDDPPKPFPVWIAHVALVSPNIERLTHFYSSVILGMGAPPEIRRVNGILNLDVVGNIDDGDLYGTWIPTPNILLEIWQYVNPPTPDLPVEGSLDKLGYTHICFEVDDVGQEIERLTALGVRFLSEPSETKSYKAVFGNDPDGNLFELRQFLNPSDPLSLGRLDLG